MSNIFSDKPSLLAIILDLSPVQWALSSSTEDSPLTLSSFLSQLLAFLNAHLAGKAENGLAVFGALPGLAVTLYTSTDGVGSSDGANTVEPTPDANSYQPFKVVDSAVVTRIVAELDALGDEEEEQSPALVGALTKALCYINRINSAAGDDPNAPEARILVLSISPDASMAYVPIMNAIFSAQKLKVSIDVAQLFGPPTTFLQQAAHLTGGAYIHLKKRDALLQYLIMSFLPPPSLRTLLAVPSQRSVDLRASCFCHRRVVDIGCVCSVCLSIFCQPVPVCTTCRTKFPMKTLQRLKASYPQPAPASAPGSAPGTPGAPRTPAQAGGGAGTPVGASQGNPSLPAARNTAGGPLPGGKENRP